jgi:hypothetical protein
LFVAGPILLVGVFGFRNQYSNGFTRTLNGQSLFPAERAFLATVDWGSRPGIPGGFFICAICLRADKGQRKRHVKRCYDLARSGNGARFIY